MLGRAITIIAYGINPRSFTKGHDRDEFDKRVVAALLTGAPVVFIDNINDALLISDTLASVLTERPSQVRVLGYSNMLEINSAAFIILTGNALKVTMDLTRRFIWTDIDARVDNPERRPFPPGFLESIRNRRGQLLAACLTILRYGRVNAGQLGRGLPVGSFEAWAEWVRDPLLALGCQDVVEGMQLAKEIDPERQEIAELYTVWHHHHNGEGVTIKDLHGDVLAILNPLKRSRQFLMRAVEKYVNTRHAGFVLLRSKGSKWSPAIYQLQVTDPYNPYKPNGDLDYRGRQPIDKAAANPITPITPILFESEPRMGDTPDTGSDKSERLVSMFRSKIKFNTRRLREQPTEDR